MNEDFSELSKKLNDILNEKNIDLSSIFSTANTTSTDATITTNDKFNFDIETILKLKDIVTKFNNNENCPRNHLLRALIPYLKNDKKEKLKAYIKIANLLSILEDNSFLPNLNLNIKKDYDYILIITLILLIL